MPVPLEPKPARPLRILHVLEATFAGAGRHVLDLIAGTVERGHEIHLAYSPLRMERRFAERLDALPDVRRIEVPMRVQLGLGDLAAIARVHRYLREQGPFDVVHGHSSKGGAIARLAALGAPGPRRVYSAHAFRTMDPTLGPLAKILFGRIEGALGRYASDLVICTSPEELAHARELGIAERKLTLVMNGIEPAPAQREQARAELGLASEQVCIGFVGRLAPQKAPERLVAAAIRLAARFPTARFVLFGTGELRSRLEAQARAATPTDRIQFVAGWPGEKAMAALDIFVLSSRYEGMPYVLIEALAAGLPIVTTHVGGASTTTRLGENGFLLPNTDDPGPLADALAWLLADPDLRARMARSSIAQSGRFRLDAMINAILERYLPTPARRGTPAIAPETA